MRPLKLTMNAFGPYAKTEVVPFYELGKSGVYIITGDTGAGKTTVFDGITFALYGEASGSHRTGNMLRSDFAAPDEKSYVELEFELRGENYKINRNPKYLRPSKRGGNPVTQNEDATLTLPDGNVLTGAEKVTKECEKLIGLTKNQFTQISMIAQGDFLRLLLAETKDRTTIFRKIFSTEKYDRLQEEIKARKNKLDSEYKELAASVLQYLGGAECKADSLFASELNVLKDEKTIHNLKEFQNLIELIIKEDEAEYEKLEEKKKVNDKIILELSEQLNLITKQKDALISVEKSLEKKNLLCEKLKNKLSASEEKISETENITKALKEQNLTLSSAEAEAEKEKLVLNGLIAQRDEINSIFKITDEKEKLLKNIDKKQKEYLAAEENVMKLSAKYNELNNIFLREQAGIMAEILTDGEPCPVCGSTVHPSLAKRENSAINEETVKRARKNEQIAREDQAEISREISALNTSLKNTEERICEKAEKLIADFSQKTNLLAELSALTEKNAALIKESKEKSELYASKVQMFLKNTKIVSENEKLAEAYKKEIEEVKKQYEMLILEIKTKEGEKNVLLSDLPFKSAEEENGKIQMLKNAKAEADTVSDDYSVRTKQIFSRINGNKNILINVAKKSKEYDKKIAEYLCYKDLSDTLNGDISGKQKIKFETYIQMAYFDKIIFEANKRFSKMTDGRFELRRKQEAASLQKQAGLELEIFDNYTGKLRSVKSLSGGESFKASLSMALGLSDVVQQRSGGIRLDAMFIDEGFGGLDSESLENALDILKELSGGNRLIGIISHVSELREQIDKKVNVSKGINGSHITVQV